MIVAVLDTNVLASGIAGISRTQSSPGEVLRRWRANTFTLGSTMNPCPCGYFGDPRRSCSCAVSAVSRYQKR